MAYNNSIPQPGDRISDSQAPILANFASIKTVIDVNHVTFDDPSGDQGKHKFVTMPVQAASPPVGAFAAGEVGFYSFLNPTTAQNEIYVNKTNQVTVTQIPATASILSITSSPANDSDGWTYLPSGLLIKWGYSNVNGVGTVNYIVGPGAFTKIFNISVSTIIDNTTTATAISSTMTQLTVDGSLRADPTTAALTRFYYSVIGI